MNVLNIFTKPKNYQIIDEKIKPLVTTMNGTGVIRTIASCQGHGWGWNQPYVYFKASERTAASIDKALRTHTELSAPTRKESWVVEGRFDENHETTYILYSPHYSRIAETSFSSFIYLFLFRKKIDRELIWLCDIVEKAAISNFWQLNQRQIS
jgi:hypothetical protein